MKRIEWTLVIQLLLLGTTACVDEATLPCGDFSLDPAFAVQDVAGAGCRLSLQMQGLDEDLGEAAFVVTTYNDRNQQQGEPQIYQITDAADPSVLVTLATPLHRKFSAYGYAVVHGMHFETESQTFEITPATVPNQVIRADSVTSAYNGDNWSEGIKGEIVVHGSGFLPFDHYDNEDLQEYVKVKSLTQDFTVRLLSATEHEMHLEYDCQNFGNQRFRLTQGGNDLEAQITVIAPDTLLSPTRPLRAYEIWRPEFANGSYSTRIGIDVTYDVCATRGTHVGALRFLPNELTFQTTQRLNGHLLDLPVTFRFDVPWEKIGSLAEDMTEYKGLRWLLGAYWWYVGDRLYRFDPASLTVRQYTLPISGNHYHRGVRFAEADDGTMAVGFWEKLGWDHKSWLYRFVPDDGSWTLLEKRDSDMTSYYDYMWQRGDTLYQLGDKVLSARSLSTNVVTRRTVNTPDRNATYVVFEDGYLFGYGVYRAERDLFWFDPMQNVLKTQHLPSLEEEYSRAPYNVLLTQLSTAPIAHHGDWVYYTNRPCMRISLADGGKTKEYLGAPLGLHDRIFLLPYDDQVLCIDQQTGDIYRFVDER